MQCFHRERRQAWQKNLMRNIQWFPGHMTKNTAYDRGESVAGRCCGGNSGRTCSAEQPQSGNGQHGGQQATPVAAEQGRYGRPVSNFPLDRSLPETGFCGSWHGLPQRKGRFNFAPAVREQLLPALLEKRAAHGMTGAPIRLMVVGIPNVGKSSFINRMAQSKRAKVEDRPGVTRTKQWVKIGSNMELLDMPGVLWPKFDDQTVAQKLAFTGAINDDVMDLEALACLLLQRLAVSYPKALEERYRMTDLQAIQEDGLPCWNCWDGNGAC